MVVDGYSYGGWKNSRSPTWPKGWLKAKIMGCLPSFSTGFSHFTTIQRFLCIYHVSQHDFPWYFLLDILREIFPFPALSGRANGPRRCPIFVAFPRKHGRRSRGNFRGMSGDDSLVFRQKISGWWFGTFLFSHILGIIIPIDFHIFQRGSNHQPEISSTLFKMG